MSDIRGFLTDVDILRILSRQDARIHFIGILGAGMLPLARLVRHIGRSVSGSDVKVKGRKVISGFSVCGHKGENVRGSDFVVTSFAIGSDNPELAEAKRLGIPVATRSQLLGALMLRYNMRIGISGSHGKSTTTALVDKILCDFGLAPTTVSGATLYDGCDMRFGSSDIFVYEACEYRDAFLDFHPTYQIITGIELDHTDYFHTLPDLVASFLKCAHLAERTVILNADFDGSDEFRYALMRNTVTYGRSESADYRYVVNSVTPEACSFLVQKEGKKLGKFTTSLPGEYNLANITAAVALADVLGLDLFRLCRSVETFYGIDRRMSRLGSFLGREILYDYAHHPTEISLAIDAVRERCGECTVVFRPHTFSRTQSLWDGFVSSLGKADLVILLDIYPAREEPIDGVTSEKLALAIGNSCVYSTPGGVPEILKKNARGAVVLMGAGDLSDVIEELKIHKEN